MALVSGRSVCATCLALALLVCTQISHSQSVRDPLTPSPVTGESWLQHLHRSFDETSMGKTGRLGPAPDQPIDTRISSARRIEKNLVEKQSVTLRGADLYRLNCRGCHGEFGQGAPPEINSVINPVRSSSAALVMARMRQVGMDMKPAEAARLAKQSEDALLLRLRNGGQDMPAFRHLSEADIRALVAYLRELAEVPGARSRQFTVQETRERIGEHIVKSTCHTCHSAWGANPSAQQLAEGAIPPLSALIDRVNEAQFIHKVTEGATIEMGSPALRYRGRMPVFYYLTREEAADAYQYLATYSADEEEDREPAIVLASQIAEAKEAEPPPTNTAAATGKHAATGTAQAPTSDIRPMEVAVFGAALVSLLLVGMAGFAVHECSRLAIRKSEHAGRETDPTPSVKKFSKQLERQRIA